MPEINPLASLNKPLGTSVYNIEDFNYNAQKIQDMLNGVDNTAKTEGIIYELNKLILQPQGLPYFTDEINIDQFLDNGIYYNITSNTIEEESLVGYILISTATDNTSIQTYLDIAGNIKQREVTKQNILGEWHSVTANIIDNLTGGDVTDTKNALSANQGKLLNEKKLERTVVNETLDIDNIDEGIYVCTKGVSSNFTVLPNDNLHVIITQYGDGKTVASAQILYDTDWNKTYIRYYSNLGENNWAWTTSFIAFSNRIDDGGMSFTEVAEANLNIADLAEGIHDNEINTIIAALEAEIKSLEEKTELTDEEQQTLAEKQQQLEIKQAELYGDGPYVTVIDATLVDETTSLKYTIDNGTKFFVTKGVDGDTKIATMYLLSDGLKENGSLKDYNIFTVYYTVNGDTRTITKTEVGKIGSGSSDIVTEITSSELNIATLSDNGVLYQTKQLTKLLRETSATENYYLGANQVFYVTKGGMGGPGDYSYKTLYLVNGGLLEEYSDVPGILLNDLNVFNIYYINTDNEIVSSYAAKVRDTANTTFKTINNESILGTGNITIGGGGSDISLSIVDE